ncbi:lectin [Thermomonas sp.]|uniref:lectin n=1 Tax=Thermomonas sp. TaxID=1971895 RepID=UPI00257FABB6|nr:lectin [Thermomonas sp.]
MRLLLPLVLLAMLAACKPAATPATSAAPAEPVAAPQAEAPGAAAAQQGLAGFGGYGDVRLGIPAADMEQAWGGALERLGPPPEPADGCHYLRPKRAARSAEDQAFMLEGGRFVRYDIEGERETAPGGGRIGMHRSDIARLYPNQVEARPHHYTDGEYLRIRDPAGGAGVLVFETDGRGDDARVLAWRVGLPPQVDYVEGCS